MGKAKCLQSYEIGQNQENKYSQSRIWPSKTDFEEADKLFFDQIEAELMDDETLQTQARVNKIDTFKFAFNDKFIDKLIGRMDQNQEIFEKILEDKVFGDVVKELMMRKIYKKLNE